MVDEKLNVPHGGEFLFMVRDYERRCEVIFDNWLSDAGVKAPRTMGALGTALAYLDRIASCRLDCRQASHVEERLIARVASNARAALYLLRSGYYDEALGLVRQIGETANLASLFVQSPELHEEWKDASESVPKTSFRPVEVRRRLEKLPLPLPMDRNTYGVLSRQTVHVNLETSPQTYNPLNRPSMGAYFQEVGALLVLNYLGGMVGWVLWLGVTLVKPSVDSKVAIDASVALLRSIGGINLNTAQEYLNTIRQSLQFNRDIDQVDQ